MYVGIDAGASATKAVILSKSENIVSYSVVPSGIDFKASSANAVKKALEAANLTMKSMSNVVSTGYGRALVDAKSTSSEIVCISRGTHRLFPSVRTIIDVGGQDSKAIRINDAGRVLNFEMNDKCAAGTGRFLEVMSSILGKPLEELGRLHFRSESPAKISSTCTVFAESEVISSLSSGCKVEDVVAGIHTAMAERIYNMSSRIGFKEDLVFTGGVAKNQGFVDALSKKVGLNPILPEEPQIVCALGAALAALQRDRKDVEHP